MLRLYDMTKHDMKRIKGISLDTDHQQRLKEYGITIGKQIKLLYCCFPSGIKCFQIDHLKLCIRDELQKHIQVGD